MTSTVDDHDPVGSTAGSLTGPAGRSPCRTGNVDGPAVVALGGGHGLASSLQAARRYAGTLTGVVSVGDDGGSSGRLRAEFGVAAPGDVRRCISALAGDNMLSRSLEYRFGEGAKEGPLTGHPVGNLLLIGLTMASGDFQAAIDELCRLAEVEGCLHPATAVPVKLLADSDDGVITGQVTIERVSGIRDLRFDPPDPPVPHGVVSAVGRADQIIIGPGSLFTSVLATAVVPGIRAALAATPAQRVFVANVANDRAEARGFGLAEHLETVAAHGIPIDVVIADRSGQGSPGSADRAPGEPADHLRGTPIEWCEVAAEDGWGHDPARLGDALAAVLDRRRQP